MRYAYSSVEKRLHDRDCAEVSKIPDTEFEMLTEYRTDLKRCWLCGRRAIVRAGISCDDAKHMDAYIDLLRRFGAMTGELYALIIVNHAQLFDVRQDCVCIRCGEDTWMLRGDQTELSLYHNNYEVLENYKRLLKPTFHLQQTSTQPHAFRFLMNPMLHYSWPEHVERFKAEALVQKQEALRARFQQVSNVVRQKRWSLLDFYYTVIDYEDKLCMYCSRKQGASESCLRRNATAVLSNFALPCAPLGSETVFDGGGAAERGQYQSSRCRLCNDVRGISSAFAREGRQLLIMSRYQQNIANQLIFLSI